MSNIIDLNELRKELKEKVSLEDWTKFAEAQFNIIEKYEKELKFLKEKNKNLETLLLSRSNFTAEPLTPEESICIDQISRLEVLSRERQLTLEEVKRFDLLVKNLKIIREESTIILNSKKPELAEADLVAIIRSEKEDQS
jgi:hypothetical protein